MVSLAITNTELINISMTGLNSEVRNGCMSGILTLFALTEGNNTVKQISKKKTVLKLKNPRVENAMKVLLIFFLMD